MEQYINKDVLVEEIERMKVDAIQFPFEEYGTVGTCNKLLSFLDTLEVKEVDLEKSISDWLNEGLPNEEELIDYIKETAERFFELGIKLQKGE